jgi:hypothetical protein
MRRYMRKTRGWLGKFGKAVWVTQLHKLAEIRSGFVKLHEPEMAQTVVTRSGNLPNSARGGAAAATSHSRRARANAGHR